MGVKSDITTQHTKQAAQIELEYFSGNIPLCVYK